MVAAALIEELLRSGSQTASKLIAHTFDDKTKTSLTEHRDAFNELCQSMYVFRAPIVTNKEQENAAVPKLQIDEHNLFTTVDLDLNEIIKLKDDETVVTKDRGKSTNWNGNKSSYNFLGVRCLLDGKYGQISSRIPRRADSFCCWA